MPFRFVFFGAFSHPAQNDRASIRGTHLSVMERVCGCGPVIGISTQEAGSGDDLHWQELEWPCVAACYLWVWRLNGYSNTSPSFYINTVRTQDSWSPAPEIHSPLLNGDTQDAFLFYFPTPPPLCLSSGAENGVRRGLFRVRGALGVCNLCLCS